MRRRIPWLHVAGGTATGLALILATLAILSQAGLGRRNCQGIELVKAQIRTVMVQNARTLGQPGSPGYAYYSAHSRELAQARLFNARSMHAFRAHSC